MKLIAAIVCLLIGCGAIVVALSYVDHMAALGPHGRDITGGLVVVFLLFAPTGLVLLLWQRPGAQPSPSVEATQRYGLEMGVYGLTPQASYRVIRPIKDYHGNEFAVGETLTFIQRHFLPYDGGHTVVFRPRPMYLQEKVNADVLDALKLYLEKVADPLPFAINPSGPFPTEMPPLPPNSAVSAAEPTPLRVWQTKYSSTELMSLLLYPDGVTLQVQSLGVYRDSWTHAQVLAGEADRTIRTGFVDEVLAELKTEIRAHQPVV